MSKVKHRRLPEISPDVVARFWGKVQIKDSDSCWLWSGGRKPGGYGNINISGKIFISSRVAYFIAKKSDPLEKEVCHSCDNPPCCNPEHLFLGTHQENIFDMVKKGRLKTDTAHVAILSNRISRKNSAVAAINPVDVRLIRNIWEGGAFSRRFIMYHFRITGNFFETIIHKDLWHGVPMVQVELRKRKQGVKPGNPFPKNKAIS